MHWRLITRVKRDQQYNADSKVISSYWSFGLSEDWKRRTGTLSAYMFVSEQTERKNIYIGRNYAGQNHQNCCPVKLLCTSRLVSGLSSCPLNSPDWHYSNRPEASDFPQWEQIHRSRILIWCSDWFRYPSGLSAG